MANFALGRRTPPDFAHVERYPLSAVREAFPVPATVEKSMDLPAGLHGGEQLHFYDQSYGRRLNVGACVGFSETIRQSIRNRMPFDAVMPWQWARLNDEFDDNNNIRDPSQGTTVRAGLQFIKSYGLRRLKRTDGQPPPDKPDPPVADLAHGIESYRWGKKVDDLRAAINANEPVVMGTAWFDGWFNPTRRGREWWVADNPERWGDIAGGHAWCLSSASDRRQAAGIRMSWDWPNLVWIPYETIRWLMENDEYAEMAVITDRATQ